MERVTAIALAAVLSPGAARAASFEEDQQLIGAGQDHQFGSAVDTDGTTLVVGAPGFPGAAGNGSGAVFIYIRSASGWTQQQQIEASDAAAFDGFGTSVAVDGDRLIVGSPFDDTLAGVDAGSAYVFERTGSTWTQEQKLEDITPNAGNEFGTAVDISGTTAAVGAPGDRSGTFDSGTVSVFTRSGTTWSLQATLVATDNATGDAFGSAVVLEGDTALVGAPDKAGGPFVLGAGAAYVFTRSASLWSQDQKLLPGNVGTDSHFGISIDLSGDQLIVGADMDDNNVGQNVGGAFVYEGGGATPWVLDVELTPGDGANGDGFGADVAIRDDVAVVGSVNDITVRGSETGSTYVFERRQSSWRQAQKILATDGGGSDQFGYRIALEGNDLFVGAFRFDFVTEFDAGAVYFLAAAQAPTSFALSTGVSGGEQPGPAPGFADFTSVGRAGATSVYIGGLGLGRSGVYSYDGTRTTRIVDANTDVPGSTGTFDTAFVEVGAEGTDIAFSSDLGVYVKRGGSALEVIANADTNVPGAAVAGTTFASYEDIAVSDGDVFFIARGTQGFGVFRDRSGTLLDVVDDRSLLPRPGGGSGSVVSFDEIAAGQGALAIRATALGGPGVYKASSATSPVVTSIADNQTFIPGALTRFAGFQEIYIRSGLVTFVGGTGRLADQGIYQGDGVLPLETVIDSSYAVPSSNPVRNFSSFELIGEDTAGNVAFIGYSSQGLEGVFTARASTAAATTIYDASDPLPGRTTGADSIPFASISGTQITIVATGGAGADIPEAFDFDTLSPIAGLPQPLGPVPGGQSWVAFGPPRIEGDFYAVYGETAQNQKGVFRGQRDIGVLSPVIDNGPALPGLLQFISFPSYDINGSMVVFSAEDENGDLGLYENLPGGFPSILLTAPGTLPSGGTLADPTVRVGTEVFFADETTGIYERTGTTQILVDASTPDPDGVGTLGPPFSLRDAAANTIVFIADDSSGNPTLYRKVGSTPAELLANDQTANPDGLGQLDGFSTTTEASLFDNEVAFVADDPTGTPVVYKWSGGTVTSLVRPGDALAEGGTVSDLSATRISLDGGKLAFTAENGSSDNGVFLLTGSTITTLVDETTPGFDFNSFQAVAAGSSVIAFAATNNSNAKDVYFVELNPPPSPRVPLPGAWLVLLGLLAIGALTRPASVPGKTRG